MSFAVDMVVNEGTDYEYSLSVPIRQLINNNLWTPENIQEYVFAGLTDDRVQYIANVEDPSVITNNSTNHTYNDKYNLFTLQSWSNNTPNHILPNIGSELQAFEFYQRNFLVSPATPGSTALGLDTLRLVLDIKDIKKWMMDFDTNPVHTQVTLTSENGNSGNGFSGTVYHWGTNDAVGPTITTRATPPAGTTVALHVASMCIINNELWWGYLNPATNHNEFYTMQGFTRRYNAYGNSSQTNQYRAGKRGMQTASTAKYSMYAAWVNEPVYPPSSDIGTSSADKSFYIVGKNDNIIDTAYKYNDDAQGVAYTSVSATSGYLAKTYDTLLKWLSWCGIYFKINNVLYKPIISGGIITGYTSDMSKQSDFDNMSNVTGNNVPVTPPAPVPSDDDDFDDHKMGAGSGISGMANLWLLTKSQLDDLHGAFNSAPGGFDPMNSLISVMGLGVAPTYLMNDIQYITPINIRKSDGTSWSTGVEGHIVDAQKSAFQFTGIRVDRMYNNFLDYSPYAIHEIFIPMCGWLTLPDIAVDRAITVTYLPDIESLKCRAVVSVVDNSGYRCVIGEKDGIMGADVPFTNTGHSLYVGEAIINGMNVAGEVITGAIGAGFTKTNAKGGTYRPYEGFTVGMGGTLPGAIGNALVSGQTNRTHYMTGNGTRIGFSDGENIQIKSTYHKIDKPDNYDHTVGKVCNKTGKLSEFSGFTVCDNPHINISALEDEKSEIKSLLEQGVIL